MPVISPSNIKSETRVGLFILIGIIFLVLGLNFLKGKSLFKRNKKIYAVFSELGPLSKSNEVKINGYVIGNISGLKAMDKDLSGFVATIKLKEDVNIPTNSIAYISSPLLGSSFINIEKGDATLFLRSGDTLRSSADNRNFGIQTEINPMLSRLKSFLDSLFTIKHSEPQVEK